MKKINKNDLQINPELLRGESPTKDDSAPTIGRDDTTNSIECYTVVENICPTKQADKCPNYTKTPNCGETLEKTCPTGTFATVCMCNTTIEQDCQTNGCGTASKGELCCDKTHNEATECAVISNYCNSREYCQESEDCTVHPCLMPSISEKPGCMVPITKTAGC